MIQIIIAILIFILVGIISVDTVKAGKYYCCFMKIEPLQSDQRLGANLGSALNQEGIDSTESTKLIDVISRGISEEDLKSLLSEMGASEAVVQKILARLDAMGAATSTPPAASSVGQKQATPSMTIKTKSSPPVKSPEGGAVGGGILSPELQEIKQQVTELREAQVQALQSLKTAEPEARKTILTELQTKRQALVENIQTSRQEIRENAQTLRLNFKERIKVLKDGGTPALDGSSKDAARVAIAHAYGVRVANRFQAAIARLDNILNRLGSRTAKLEAEGGDVSEIAPAIEEAKNMLTESKAKLVELEAAYEEMLVSDNPGELAREAAAKAEELKNQLAEVVEAAKTAGKGTVKSTMPRPTTAE